jgi:hypothetical protein
VVQVEVVEDVPGTPSLAAGTGNTPPVVHHKVILVELDRGTFWIRRWRWWSWCSWTAGIAGSQAGPGGAGSPNSISGVQYFMQEVVEEQLQVLVHQEQVERWWWRRRKTNGNFWNSQYRWWWGCRFSNLEDLEVQV